ncbi:GIY-YIG nuclease family protein [Aliikangiella sp. IMCC44359]|uniref:GIY-YIG nuclease family protein n=1 Tax=Aliikangiella sp. IMCC44359 TaxID=3459125 RepID=UPI00403AD5CF
MSCWYVYIIKAENEKLYTGITTDFIRRFNEHFTAKKGAKFFNISKPKEAVYLTEVKSRSEACKLEAEIKKYKRTEKLNLVDSPNNKIKKYLKI